MTKGIKANKNDYNLSLTKKLVLITTGSLGASTINEKIVNMLNMLLHGWSKMKHLFNNSQVKQTQEKKYWTIQHIGGK